MSFNPINEWHAIAEVIFILQVEPKFAHEEISTIKEAHDNWKAMLPSVEKYQLFGLGFDDDKPVPPPPPPPASFTRYKSDGSIELRLHIDGDNIIVACGLYSRWNLVWKNTRKLFEVVVNSLTSTSRKINSAGLQYTDEFTWSGEGQYDVRQILNENSKFVPSSVLDYGHGWHLQQGWFDNCESPVPGRMLKHMQISTLNRNSDRVVQFQNLNKYDVAKSNILLSTAFSGDSCQIDEVFDSLHSMNKSLLTEFLNDEISNRIQLNVE